LYWVGPVSSRDQEGGKCNLVTHQKGQKGDELMLRVRSKCGPWKGKKTPRSGCTTHGKTPTERRKEQFRAGEKNRSGPVIERFPRPKSGRKSVRHRGVEEGEGTNKISTTQSGQEKGRE